LEGGKGAWPRQWVLDIAWALPTTSLIQSIDPWATATIVNSQGRKHRGKKSRMDKGEKRPTILVLVWSDAAFPRSPIGVTIVHHWHRKVLNV
jgi:hypothetical protein